MLRSVGAVVVGLFATMIFVVVSTMALTVAFLGSMRTYQPQKPNVEYLIGNLACSLLAAGVGGYVCAWIAPGRPMLHGGVLAGMFLVSGVSAQGLEADNGQPSWYSYAITVICLIGVVGGAAWRTVLMPAG
jgi:hypothetical protein